MKVKDLLTVNADYTTETKLTIVYVETGVSTELYYTGAKKCYGECEVVCFSGTEITINRGEN